MRPKLLGLLLLAVPATLMAAPTAMPHTFEASTPARAADVNDNFSALLSGINDKDTRLTAIESLHPLASAAGVSAYVTTTDGTATLGTSFNSSGGGVTITGSGGSYTATFKNVDCAGKGAAVVAPYVGSTALACRVGAMTEAGSDCRIAVACFDATGTLRAGSVSITYMQ